MSFGAQFLTGAPRTVMSGEQGWGDFARDIHLPFGTCRFSGMTYAQTQALDALDARNAPLDEADVDIDVRSAGPALFRDIQWDGRDYELEFQYHPDRISWAGDGFLVELDSKGKCRLWTRVDQRAQFAGVAQNVLRVVTACRLLDIGGLLLHSAGVRFDDEAVLFFGISGAGKSTVAASALQQGREVFSDDLNALVPASGDYLVAAVPFTGDVDESTARREQLPLKSLYHLRQSDRNSIVELPAAEGVARLAVCAPFVNVDPHRQARLLDVLSRLVARVPVKVLRFQKPVDFWREMT